MHQYLMHEYLVHKFGVVLVFDMSVLDVLEYLITVLAPIPAECVVVPMHYAGIATTTVVGNDPRTPVRLAHIKLVWL